MSKLDELIRELCPDGVEYVRLGTLCSLITKQTGFDYTKHIKARLLMEPTKNAVPYIQTKFFSGKNFNYQTDYYVPMDIVEQFPKITLDEKCILFSIVGASIGNVGLFPGERKCFLGGAICVAKVLPQYDVDYIYYCVEAHNVQHQIRRKTKGAGQATITVEDIREFEIPLPPIEVQREIVRILDDYTKNVTELQRQLAAEMTARKTQYTYYRDELLTNNYNSKIKRLEECCDSIADGDHQAPPKADSGIPFITISDIDERHEINFNVIKYVPNEYYNRLADKRRPQKGDVLYTVVGSYGIPVYVKENKKFVFQRHIAILRPNNAVVDSRYLYHAMNGTAFHRQADLAAKGAAQKTIGLASLAKMTVPVPPLDVQNRIVNVLDNFEKICSDLNIGLPAEIEARQKQYEYYRDKLLTFAETGNTILSRAEQSTD